MPHIYYTSYLFAVARASVRDPPTSDSIKEHLVKCTVSKMYI